MSKVQQDAARLRNALLKSFSVLALVTLPVSAFCVIFAPEIVDLLLGGKWQAAVVPFAILSGTLYFTLAWRNCTTLFQALGRPYWITAVQIGRAAALIAGIWWIAPHGLTAICAVIGSVMAPMLGVMLVIVKYRDRSSASKHGCGTRPSAPGHCSSERPLSHGEGAVAWVSWAGPRDSHDPVAPFVIVRLRLLQPGAHVRIQRDPGAQPTAYRKKMKLILHIGTHRTGTTALQRFLYANREPLAAQEFTMRRPDTACRKST